MDDDEILVSFDAEALYPSIPLSKCITVIEQRLTADSTLSSRIPLTPNEIVDLVKLCFSTSDFIYDGVHHTAEDSGPIGLSLMVDIAKVWMDHTLQEATKIAIQKEIAVPRNMCVYIDDSFGILRQNASKTAHIEFAACLSEVDERLKFTYEIEENEQRLLKTIP